MTNITEREKEILLYIQLYMMENGISPSYEDIKKGVYLSSNCSLQRHLESLERKGYIVRHTRVARGIVLKNVV